MQPVTLSLAFLAGVVSFFAPCVLPLLPAYIAYVVGISTNEAKSEEGLKYNKKIFLSGLLYVLGFSIVFVGLGIAAGGIGATLRRHTALIQQIGGVFLILFGLEYGGFKHFHFLSREVHFKLPRKVSRLGVLRSFVIGILFAITWTPCVGPVLGSILALAAVSATTTQGALMLFVYSLGISIPFFVIALSLSQAPRKISIFKKHIGTISKISGIVMLVLGVLLLTGTYKHLNAWVFSITKGWEVTGL